MDKKRMPIYGIKGKLVSACCMLLVAVIMVVSSTYAWFTLSTAPEVKGITTSIGANGALEIRLNATNDTLNGTPGNVVDLGEGYGLDQITLYPSELHLDADGTINNRFLNVPEYGANGKVTEVSGERTEAGSFVSGTGFVAGSAFGVRAVGVASGLTPRQLAYRNAKYAASTNAGLATNKAASSLNTNGPVLGNIVIKKATVADPTFTQAEIDSLQAIVNDLGAAETGVLQYIEAAYEQMLIAFAASAQLDTLAGDNVELADAIYSTVKTNIESGTLTLQNIVNDSGIVITVDTTEYKFDLTGNKLLEGIQAFLNTQANVAAAQDALTDLESKTEYTWTDITPVLNKLIVIDNVTVNEKTADAIKNDMDGFANSVMTKGINIALNSGAGVYVEIADQCGDYSAKVTMTNVEVKGILFESLTANMATKSSQTTAYLTGAQAAVVAAGEPSGATASAQPMTEFYGYIIDLVFKTNAANSNLLLQTEATDRIYKDNNNELTQGGGSYMTFKSAASDFSNDQVKGLMENIRIVFFDTDTQKILGYAMLDVAGSSVGADGVTAKIYLYETVDTYTYTYTPDGGEETTVEYFVRATKNNDGTTTYKYYDMETDANVTASVKAMFDSEEEANPFSAETAIPSAFVKGNPINKALDGAKDSELAPAITSLAQNQDVKVSALVYLDGANITNADVSATGTTSVTGKMNLQFSSSAELVPMEYGDLHTPTTND